MSVNRRLYLQCGLSAPPCTLLHIGILPVLGHSLKCCETLRTGLSTFLFCTVPFIFLELVFRNSVRRLKLLSHSCHVLRSYQAWGNFIPVSCWLSAWTLCTKNCCLHWFSLCQHVALWIKHSASWNSVCCCEQILGLVLHPLETREHHPGSYVGLWCHPVTCIHPLHTAVVTWQWRVRVAPPITHFFFLLYELQDLDDGTHF